LNNKSTEELDVHGGKNFDSQSNEFENMKYFSKNDPKKISESESDLTQSQSN